MIHIHKSPIFIIGAPRSGTTLLYAILLSSGDFALYEAETMILSVCKPKYGDIRKEANLLRFLKSWLNSKQFHRSGLDALKFKDDVVNKNLAYSGFLSFFMDTICTVQGKNRWAEQTPAHLFHVKELSHQFKEAKFIHVIRDGRDVALSNYKIGWTGPKRVEKINQLLKGALNWELCVKKGRVISKFLGDRYLEIRYEDIIKDLVNSLDKLNNFVGTEITVDKIKKSRFGSLRKANTIYKEMETEGISSQGIERWKKELSIEEVKKIEKMIGETLNKKGYNLNKNNTSRSNFTEFTYKIYKIIYFIIFEIKLKLKYCTPLGKYTSDDIEVGIK